jgi:hypothetical protein
MEQTFAKGMRKARFVSKQTPLTLLPLSMILIALVSFFPPVKFSTPSRLSGFSLYLSIGNSEFTAQTNKRRECLQRDSRSINYPFAVRLFPWCGVKIHFTLRGVQPTLESTCPKKSSFIFESGSLPAPLSFPCPNHTLFVRERACFLHPRNFHRQGNFTFKNLFPLSVECAAAEKSICRRRSARESDRQSNTPPAPMIEYIFRCGVSPGVKQVSANCAAERYKKRPPQNRPWAAF